MSWPDETALTYPPYSYFEGNTFEGFDEANSLQGDVKRLIESTGLTDMCKNIGFIEHMMDNEKNKMETTGMYNGVNFHDPRVLRYQEQNTFIAPAPTMGNQALDTSADKSQKRIRSNAPSDDEDDSSEYNKKKKRTSKSKNKGLRHFSKQVCDKVQEKKKTTYNEVADELVKELTQVSEINGKRVDSKNIRRRVYDALNVLMAMNIIEKEKKEIRWRGLPTTDVRKEASTLEQEIQIRQERIQKKKEYLQELEMQRVLYKNLIERNAHRGHVNDEERIFLPFIIIHTKKETSIECEMSEDRTEYFFDFSLPFSIHDDNEILKRMGLADPYWKQHTQQQQQHPLTQQHPLSHQLVLPQHGLSQQPLTQQALSQQQLQQHHQQQHHLHHQQHQHHPHGLGEISDFSIMDHFSFGNPN